MKRNKYGEILASDFKKEIELADTIEDIANLRDILESDLVENKLETSTLLSFKESEYGLIL